PADIYKVLSTPEGLKRAIDEVRVLAPHAVWWDNAAGAIAHLRSGQAAIALAYSGRAFQEFATTPAIATLWDGQVYDLNYWAVPKSARHKDAAWEFVAFATAPERLAATARHFPYGPARRSAVGLVGRHAVLGIELASHLPTAPANMTRALRFDAAWWAENEARVTDLFNAMINETGAASAAVPGKAAPKTTAPPPKRVR
ncbi:MAG TPA: extracellular solute-binding protein, partial [Hyphomicrobiaceae bacterium]|nr:extracellular solute-binding protein [Hyphomicrobiaceae bacterium]